MNDLFGSVGLLGIVLALADHFELHLRFKPPVRCWHQPYTFCLLRVVVVVVPDRGWSRRQVRAVQSETDPIEGMREVIDGTCYSFIFMTRRNPNQKADMGTI